MIIRYGGGNSGIAEYLELGRKVDRHFTRDELDRRIPIEGDLAVTQAVYESINDEGQDRYLHISLSFNEPNVTEDEIKDVFQQYKKELMSAYGEDEFNVYAEIHWPKIKEAYNHNTEEMEPRYPHVHVVIPKKNLLTGGYFNPVGMHEKSEKYFDAIQEKLNRDNGLSSPRNSPRVGTNHYESALGKYKDKEFRSKNGELKRDIFNALVARDIRSEKSFKDLLAEYGEVRVRNQGKENQYFAVKIPGDQKFTNLKANIFGRSFLEDRALVIDPITDAQVAGRVETWRTIQSKEIKYISNASAKVKDAYKGLSLPERRNFLAQREKDYDQTYRRQEATSTNKRSGLPGLPEGNYKPGNFELAGRFAPEGTSYLHELRASNVDHFRSEGNPADRLFLQGDADNDLQHVQSDGGIGLRRDLYAGGGQGSGGLTLEDSSKDSSVLASLLAAEKEKEQQKAELQMYAEIRKGLDAGHLLAYAQIKFGVDPTQHPISRAKDGSARIKVGKYNYNVSDFLTKHIGLEWSEASELLKSLYEKQQAGVIDKPKSKVAHIDDWRKFRDEVYPNNIRTYDELKNQIKVSYSLGLKAINAEYFARSKSITKDETLTRSDKHYFRSIVILEKLQKVESLQQRVNEQNTLKNRVKYPYSTLFYDFATKNEEMNMKILDTLKRRYQTPELDSENTIGARGPLTPKHMPDGAEAAKRARLIAKLHTQEREAKELKIKLADLRPRPLANNAVAFCHKDHGKQIFVNHPDRLEMNRVTDPDEVGVGLIFAVERFGNPLEVNGTAQFKEQIIAVAAERDMDITFTDEAMNKALEAKRLELGLEPLAGNTITVPELAMDKALPLEQAADKALLASKVAELEAVNAAYYSAPADLAEREVLEGMLSDAEQRREELQSGFVDDARIEQIAQEDIAAFAYMEGKPEQQELAIGMNDAMENGTYSAYMEQNGPAELKLTIDAAQVIQAEKVAAKEARKEADMAAIESPALRFEIANPLTDATHVYKTEADAQAGAAELGSSRYTAIMADATKINMVQHQGQWASETTVLEAAAAARKELEQAIGQASPAPALTPEEREQMNKARADMGMEPLEDSVPADPQPSTIEPLQFTNDGQPATIDLNRFQQAEPPSIERLQAEVAGYGQAEQEARAALESLERERDSFGEDRNEVDSTALDERITEARDSLEGFSQLKAKSEQELEAMQQAAPADPQPATVEPLQFTNDGQPATIDLNRFQQAEPPSIERLQAEVAGYGQAEQEARATLENLERERDSFGEDRNEVDSTALDERITEARDSLEGFSQLKAKSEQELYQIAPELRPEPVRETIEPLQFTHNGEPATLDLNRFAAQSPALAPAVAAKVEELQAINKAFAAPGRESVVDDIVRKGTLVDATMRHEWVKTTPTGGDEIREIAKKDLATFAELDGVPEQQELARSMGQMMEHPDYRDYMAEHAPESVGVTIEASHVVEQSEPTQEKAADRDMEL
ncbi:Relaxase/Mobilisation nuclease domain-containing protein [Pseudomonas peli]|uniref:Relaxase/Mobilisation nuclease domain-containing protein n=1 Tax=Pseudomonas peli TaxID=592361 RepID=A0AB37ZE43_9PSED|nr:LPD7 domain-containing protein [Pseudomonas peli]SCW89291.1 Relaxase/Mobilisation nuclease domain-containing protein [Pseudomonas peli]